MNRLALLTLSLGLLGVASIANAEVLPDCVDGRCEGSVASGWLPVTPLSAELILPESLTISLEVAKQAADYERYLQEDKQWCEQAIEIAETTKIQSKQDAPSPSIPVTQSRLWGMYGPQYHLSDAAKHHLWLWFHDDVKSQLPPRPKAVTRPSPTRIAMKLRVTNHSFENVELNTMASYHRNTIRFHLVGNGIRSYEHRVLAHPTFDPPGKWETLQPGQAVDIPLHSTSIDRTTDHRFSVVTQPGIVDISVIATLSCKGNPSGKVQTAHQLLQVILADS